MRRSEIAISNRIFLKVKSLRVVVHHSPASLSLDPNGREPALAVRFVRTRENILTRDERVVFSEHANDEILVAKLLNGSARFPKAVLHGFLNCLDAARGTGREHLGGVWHVGGKVFRE